MRKNKAKFLILAAAFALAFSYSAMAAKKVDYTQLVKEYLDVTGSRATSEKAIDNMIAMYKSTMTDIPDEIWDAFKEKIAERFVERMVEIYEPIYRKYLTEKDLQDAIAMYKTPIGKKLVSVNPDITSDAMQAGQELGMAIASDMMEIISEYYGWDDEEDEE